MTQITTHFTWEEAATTEHRDINNMIPIAQTDLMAAVNYTAHQMELIRYILNEKPITINSWYRCLELNRAIGSHDTSQHIKGQAVDFTCKDFGNPVEVCKAIIASLIPFDQLILEHTWIHISFQSDPHVLSRRQVLSLLENKTYATGLTNKQGVSYGF